MRAPLLVKLGAGLAGGVLLNIAVAWGCVIYGASGPSIQSETPRWGVPPPGTWSDTPSRATIARRPGFTEVTAFGPPPDDQAEYRNVSQYTLTAGLPMRCLYLERRRLEVWTGLYWPLKFEQPGSWREGLRIPEQVPAFDRQPVRCLPTQPIWSGMIVNSVGYGAAVFLAGFVLPGSVRHMYRRRRRVCPACGYPIGKSSRCSECGATLLG